MAQALEEVPAEEEDLNRTIRRSLSAWTSEMNQLRVQFAVPEVAVTFSPDGETAITSEYWIDESPQLWEISTGRRIGAPLQLRANSGDAIGSPLWCSSDRKTMVTVDKQWRNLSGSDGVYDARIMRWDIETLELIEPVLEVDGLLQSAISTDGRFAATVTRSPDKNAFTVWELSTGQSL